MLAWRVTSSKPLLENAIERYLTFLILLLLISFYEALLVTWTTAWEPGELANRLISSLMPAYLLRRGISLRLSFAGGLLPDDVLLALQFAS